MNKAGRYSDRECMGCGKDTRELREYYMLHDHLWIEVAGGPNGMLCIGCVESRLGRRLRPEDFTGCYINQKYNRTNPHRSQRLSERLGYV